MATFLIYGGTLLVSFVMTWLVIRFDHLHGHLTADHDLTGTQKNSMRYRCRALAASGCLPQWH